VITSNSYAVVPFHIGEARFAKEGSGWRWPQAGAALPMLPGARCGGRFAAAAVRFYRPTCSSRERSPKC
jgi:hypothetical protein